jgi:hypothetical protein
MTMTQFGIECISAVEKMVGAMSDDEFNRMFERACAEGKHDIAATLMGVRLKVKENNEAKQ